MAELIGQADFEFARVIEAAGNCPDSFFLRLALETPNETLTLRAMPLTIGGIMVRGGFYLCEKWDTLSYYEFVQCAGIYWDKEIKRVMRDEPLDRAFMPYRHTVRGHGFVEEGNRLIMEGWHPRAVAWGLIRDGLGLCEQFEPDYYPVLLGGMLKFLVPEIRRTKAWPRIFVRPS